VSVFKKIEGIKPVLVCCGWSPRQRLIVMQKYYGTKVKKSQNQVLITTPKKQGRKAKSLPALRFSAFIYDTHRKIRM
jgi:hypothetical protein